jgi:DNA invertase Pin-like site-specific DNA recombinase
MMQTVLGLLMTSPWQLRSAPAVTAENLGARVAFSYQRVSSGQQVDGHGLDRQADAAALWCAANGHQLDQQLALSDRGRSAYRGRHLSGALGRFLELAQSGQLGSSPVLLVEAIDRLSRQEPLDAIETILSGLVGSGVRVVTLEDQQEYSRLTISTDASKLLVLVVKIQAAHEFSKRNGMRSSASWANRFRAAKAGQKDPSPRCRPYWLDWDGAADDFKANASTAMVQRCFQLSEQGLGHTAIARQLTAEGFTNTSGGRLSGTVTGVLLRDRRVLGEREITNPDGNTEILQGYFPTVITPGQFDRCRGLAADRDTAPGRNRRSKRTRNLFAPTLTCPCGLPLGHRSQSGGRYEKLICNGFHDGRCTYDGAGWLDYDEEALLRSFMAQRWSEFFNVKTDTARQRQLEGKRLQLETLLAKQRQQASNSQATLAKLAGDAQLDADALKLLSKAVGDATSAADQTRTELLKVEAALQTQLAKPNGKQMAGQIKAKVEAFVATGRQDPAERQRFNGWLRTLGVQMTLQGRHLSCLSWREGGRWGEACIYRAGNEEVVSDETLADMAVLGFSEADRAVRLEEIKAEQRRAGAHRRKLRTAQLTPPP